MPRCRQHRTSLSCQCLPRYDVPADAIVIKCPSALVSLCNLPRVCEGMYEWCMYAPVLLCMYVCVRLYVI
jgi:hypothetical protein